MINHQHTRNRKPILLRQLGACELVYEKFLKLTNDQLFAQSMRIDNRNLNIIVFEECLKKWISRIPPLSILISKYQNNFYFVEHKELLLDNIDKFFYFHNSLNSDQSTTSNDLFQVVLETFNGKFQQLWQIHIHSLSDNSWIVAMICHHAFGDFDFLNYLLISFLSILTESYYSQQQQLSVVKSMEMLCYGVHVIKDELPLPFVNQIKNIPFVKQMNDIDEFQDIDCMRKKSISSSLTSIRFTSNTFFKIQNICEQFRVKLASVWIYFCISAYYPIQSYKDYFLIDVPINIRRRVSMTSSQFGAYLVVFSLRVGKNELIEQKSITTIQSIQKQLSDYLDKKLFIDSIRNDSIILCTEENIDSQLEKADLCVSSIGIIDIPENISSLSYQFSVSTVNDSWTSPLFIGVYSIRKRNSSIGHLSFDIGYDSKKFNHGTISNYLRNLRNVIYNFTESYS
ncbi:hypothetical protein SNEBB_010364 [Seison nebaliae]|nr:hypothetical protein SNEBB_010364 [Seison nebaliae]